VLEVEHGPGRVEAASGIHRRAVVVGLGRKRSRLIESKWDLSVGSSGIETNVIDCAREVGVVNRNTVALDKSLHGNLHQVPETVFKKTP
jgi:hypothetical protein